MDPNARRDVIGTCRRIVIKLGTRVLTDEGGGLATERLDALVEAAARARKEGREVLIVSSGAVGLGRDVLQLARVGLDLPRRQACAAVGQSRLVGVYAERFAAHGYPVGQVLLTRTDFDDRRRYLNLRTTLLTMLRLGVIPIINENDAVATDELAYETADADRAPVFGDNDGLSALVASKLGADLLVLLTDVAGVFDRDPRQHTDAVMHLELPGHPGDQAIEAPLPPGGPSRGGMRSKLTAARIAARSGCHAIIASGLEPGNLAAVLEGVPTGTLIRASGDLSARARWIAWGTPCRGAVLVDRGAVDALTDRGASLLAAGVRRVDGPFAAGDVIAILGPEGKLFARGVVSCDAEVARRWAEGEAPPSAKNHHALVHRDHLVILHPASS